MNYISKLEMQNHVYKKLSSCKNIDEILLYIHDYSGSRLYVNKNLELSLDTSISPYQCDNSKSYAISRRQRNHYLKQFELMNVSFIIFNGYNFIIHKDGKFKIIIEDDIYLYKDFFISDESYKEYNILSLV